MNAFAQSVLIFLAAVLLLVANGQIKTQSYSRIALAAQPEVHSTLANVSTYLACSMACSQVTNSTCTGFQILFNRCMLLKGQIQERPNAAPRTEAETAYRVKSIHLPRCGDYKDFQLIKTPNSTYCFYFSGVEMDYESAKKTCRARGGYISFVSIWSKLFLIKEEIKTITKGVSDFWNGVFRDPGTNLFRGEYGDKLIFPNNELWNPGEPSDPTREERLCVISAFWGPFRDDLCSSTRNFACEILEFDERPYVE